MQTKIEKREVEVDGKVTACWDLACECTFLSEGWPTRKLADLRRDQHLAEHETGEPAPEKGLLMSNPERTAADGIAAALAKRST